MRPSERRLSREEAALWARVANTVHPLVRTRTWPPVDPAASQPETGGQVRVRTAPALPAPIPASPPARPALDRQTLDASWDRRLARGLVAADFTLDLHGASLDAAHARLEAGLALAIAQGARLVLLITGRLRGPVDPADRAHRRGAIRAKLFDWLEHGSHAAAIAAIRPAHPRHGGAGAVYVVLRKAR